MLSNVPLRCEASQTKAEGLERSNTDPLDSNGGVHQPDEIGKDGRDVKLYPRDNVQITSRRDRNVKEVAMDLGTV